MKTDINHQPPILLVDFDGVLHSYVSGWQGADVVADPPVYGAIDFLFEAVNYFDVQIYSSRSRQDGGIDAMKEWLERHGFDQIELLSFPTEKPAAFLTIDDRAICFDGRFPLARDLLNFKPWNKKVGGPMKPNHDIESGCFWWPIVCAVVLAVAVLWLSGCASQEFTREWTAQVPMSQLMGVANADPAIAVNDGLVTVHNKCEAKASSWWKITEAEKLEARVSCSDDRDTRFGAEKITSRGDVDMVNAVGNVSAQITEAAVKAAAQSASPLPLPGAGQ